MDYKVADFLIRTEGRHSDFESFGFVGFKPFRLESPSADEPDMIVRMDAITDSSLYPVVSDISEFEFEQEYATGRFSRYAEGYRFAMYRNGREYLFIKRDGSNIVESNLGCEEVADLSLIRFGMWMMFGIVIAPKGAIAIHSSVVVKHGAAVLCLGESGTGKSTHTRLWRENIEGAKLLNDDSPIIRIIDGVCYAYGSPWSGKTHCYINRRVPVKALMRLSQAPHNKIRRLPALAAIGAVLPSCPPAFATDTALQDAICDTVSGVIASTPIYHLECLPDAAAAQLSYSTIFNV